jgi:hypothetical protein
MKDKRHLRASMKVEIAYHEGKDVLIRRFASDTEIKDFLFSPHKLIDEKKSTLSNEILVLMYSRMDEQSFEKSFSGGNYNFNVDNPSGIDIEIHVKQPDPELRVELGDIARGLCTKHLKPAFILPSRYYISCKINKCELPEEKVEVFCSDFLNELQTKMETFSITKKEKTIEILPPKQINDPKQDWIQDEHKSEDKPEAVYKKCSFCYNVVEDIEKCKYCGGWFCRDHLEPKTPHDFLYLRTPGGHSCRTFMEQEKLEKPTNTPQKEKYSKEDNPKKEKKSFWQRLRGK